MVRYLTIEKKLPDTPRTRKVPKRDKKGDYVRSNVPAKDKEGKELRGVDNKPVFNIIFDDVKTPSEYKEFIATAKKDIAKLKKLKVSSLLFKWDSTEDTLIEPEKNIISFFENEVALFAPLLDFERQKLGEKSIGDKYFRYQEDVKSYSTSVIETQKEIDNALDSIKNLEQKVKTNIDTSLRNSYKEEIKTLNSRLKGGEIISGEKQTGLEEDLIKFIKQCKDAIKIFNDELKKQFVDIKTQAVELFNDSLKVKIGELSTDAKNPKKKEILETKPSVNKTIGEYLFPKDIKQIMQMLSSVESAKQLRDYLNKIGKPEIENFSVEMPETTEEGDWAEGVTVEDIKDYNNRVKTSAGRNSVRSYALEQANNKFNLIEDESVKSKLEEILGLSVEMQSLRDKKSLKVRSATITALENLLKRIEKYVSVLESGKPSNLNSLLGKDTKTRKNTIGYLKRLQFNTLAVTRWDFKKGKWDNFKPYNIKEGEESGATKYSKSYLRYEELESLGEKINTILNERVREVAIDEAKKDELDSQIEEIDSKLEERARKETRITNLIDTLKEQLKEPQYSNDKKALDRFKNLIDKNKKNLEDLEVINAEYADSYADKVIELYRQIDGDIYNQSVLEVIEDDLQTTTDTILLSKKEQKLFIKNRKKLEDFIKNAFDYKESGLLNVETPIAQPAGATPKEKRAKLFQIRIDEKDTKLDGSPVGTVEEQEALYQKNKESEEE